MYKRCICVSLTLASRAGGRDCRQNQWKTSGQVRASPTVASLSVPGGPEGRPPSSYKLQMDARRLFIIICLLFFETRAKIRCDTAFLPQVFKVLFCVWREGPRQQPGRSQDPAEPAEWAAGGPAQGLS